MPRTSAKDKNKKDLRCGMVSIVGRPNVGKSTLLNCILGEKVAIVSKVPQTTRNRIRGVHNCEKGQIIFIDTPGLVLGKDKLDKFLKSSSLGSMNDADCVIHLVDACERVGKEEEEIVRRLNTIKSPIVLGLNKVDKKVKYANEYISLWEKAKGMPATEIENFAILPLSSKEEIHIEQLVDILFEHLPQSAPLYPVDVICDIPQRLAISDIIREKLIRVLRDEVPHSIAVVIESIKPKRKKTTHIQAVILIERESQKEIVIGKGGSVLKRVGTTARLELEDLLEGKVFLEMRVKTKKKWRDNVSLLQEMGYDSKII